MPSLLTTLYFPFVYLHKYQLFYGLAVDYKRYVVKKNPFKRSPPLKRANLQEVNELLKMEVVIDTIVPSFSLMNESFPYLNMLCQTCLSSSNKTEHIFQENNFKRSFDHAFIFSFRYFFISST